MEFNLSTFILETINFLILIWILQRLFYKPLLEVIAKRKQSIDQALADSKAIHEQAEEQRRLYENRQKLWEQEKQSALTALHLQIETERRTQMIQLEFDLEQERKKNKMTLQRQNKEFKQQAEKQALENGARFAALLLRQSASPELEARLLSFLLDNLNVLPTACTLCLQMLGSKKLVPIKISSAFPLTTEQKLGLEQKLATLINTQINCQYHQDTNLIAGIRLDIGAWVLNSNVQHELIGFSELANESD